MVLLLKGEGESKWTEGDRRSAVAGEWEEALQEGNLGIGAWA